MLLMPTTRPAGGTERALHEPARAVGLGRVGEATEGKHGVELLPAVGGAVVVGGI